ncbi:MAG: MBL fold metallo-hydrolase [Candidatus Woesearchaeota archaeon]|jgi:phosphoribosyl 1,2-cyclic phosphodiesterase|nr:MBL fold metallo-hydrolase [Candidatus Woesearchaeota archaeon]
MRSFALASGSSGNCYYVETDKVKILVDVGLSFKKIKEILDSRGVEVEDIDYIFITHEHSDHASGLPMFLKNVKNVKILLSQGTYDGLKLKLENYEIIKNHQIVTLEDLKTFVVEKPHDTIEAMSFVFENNGMKVGIFTDIGYIGDEIKHILKSLNVVYFEANYCQSVIKNNSDLNYNYVNRLTSDEGHLGLDECCDVLKNVTFDSQKIILSHISTNTNFYENAYVKVKNSLKEVGLFPEIFVSFQGEATDWF